MFSLALKNQEKRRLAFLAKSVVPWKQECGEKDQRGLLRNFFSLISASAMLVDFVMLKAFASHVQL